MYRWLWLVAVGWASCSLLQAQEDKSPPAKQEPAKPADSAKAEFTAIQKEWQNQQMAFRKKYQEAKAEDRQKLFQTDYPKAAPLAARCLAMAAKWPDAAESVDALFWALTNDETKDTQSKCVKQLKAIWLDKASLDEINKKLARNYYMSSAELHSAVMEQVDKHDKDPKAVSVLLWLNRQSQINPESTAAKKAMDVVLSKYLDSKEIGPLCMMLGDANDAKSLETLKTILDKNGHDDVKASACVALGKQLGKKEATQSEAEKYLKRAINEFPDAGKAIKATAKGELNELLYLSIGKVVPDVKGNDLDDKEFKLSDYRGKVVLLDFWGFW